MATLTHNNIAKAIYLSGKGKKGKALDEVLRNAVSFLNRRKLLSKSQAILSSLEKIENNDNGILKAEIWSKNRLDSGTKKKLLQILKNRYKGKDFILTENIDESLLGGFKVRIGDELIDLSLKNKIYELQEHLTRNI